MQNPDPVIYQLKVVLQDISPMIWRRLLVCGDTTIADLHYIIQIAMGWSDYHLHQFRIHGKRYGICRIGGISFSDDPHTVRLKDLRLRIKVCILDVLWADSESTARSPAYQQYDQCGHGPQQGP